MLMLVRVIVVRLGYRRPLCDYFKNISMSEPFSAFSEGSTRSLLYTSRPGWKTLSVNIATVMGMPSSASEEKEDRREPGQHNNALRPMESCNGAY